jgi:RNA-directed DNA polymerase
MNTVDLQPLSGWNTLNWQQIERVVFKLQTRIYRAQRRGADYHAGDVLEVDHIIPTAFGGKDGYDNWQLLHGHCHDEKTAEDRHRYA